jgi:hypothetical protein
MPSPTPLRAVLQQLARDRDQLVSRWARTLLERGACGSSKKDKEGAQSKKDGKGRKTRKYRSA